MQKADIQRVVLLTFPSFVKIPKKGEEKYEME